MPGRCASPSKPGGCAGLLYKVTFDVVPTESDVVVKSQGVQVVLRQDSARYINGAVIDFAADSLIVRNPNAATSCSPGRPLPLGPTIAPRTQPRSELISAASHADGRAFLPIKRRPPPGQLPVVPRQWLTCD